MLSVDMPKNTISRVISFGFLESYIHTSGLIAIYNVCMRVDPTYLLLCGTLEHDVHETAEHDQQLLLVDIAQPQCGSAELECMYV